MVGLPIDEIQGLIRDVPKPVIARVNGFAIGGGNVLADTVRLDHRRRARPVRAGRPKVGSVDAGWGTAFLARHVGDKKSAADPGSSMNVVAPSRHARWASSTRSSRWRRRDAAVKD